MPILSEFKRINSPWNHQKTYYFHGDFRGKSWTNCFQSLYFNLFKVFSYHALTIFKYDECFASSCDFFSCIMSKNGHTYFKNHMFKFLNYHWLFFNMTHDTPSSHGGTSTPRHWNTGLVSSEASLTSWGEGASLALVGDPSSDGVTIKMPYGGRYFTSTSLPPHLPIGLVKTESGFIVRSVETGLGRWMVVVAVSSVDLYPFLAF